jgi:hypothetical protein
MRGLRCARDDGLRRLCRVFPLEKIYAATDAEGKTVLQELEKIGYVGQQTPGDHPIGAYFEAHIEQGPILEEERSHWRGPGRTGDPLV